jgi:hypothetical protein
MTYQVINLTENNAQPKMITESELKTVFGACFESYIEDMENKPGEYVARSTNRIYRMLPKVQFDGLCECGTTMDYCTC